MGNKKKEIVSSKITSRLPKNMAPLKANFTYFFKKTQKSLAPATPYFKMTYADLP